MKNKIKVVISGVQGYIGNELLRLVTEHDYLQLVAVQSRQSKQDLYQLFPQLVIQHIPVYTLDEMLEQASMMDVLLLATPADASIEIALAFADKGIKIIDLSGAFRLPAEQFEQWYGFKHKASELIEKACYGLTPWMKQQAHYSLIANPGCYASCALMSLLPLIAANIINPKNLIIDAKSGVSGSGKQMNADLMFCEIANNFYPYKLGKHQHTPEINKAIYDMTANRVNIRLTTSLLPVVRGISMTLYCEASPGLGSDGDIAKAVAQAYAQAYQGYELVKCQQVGIQSPAQEKAILSLNQVTHTPNCHIGYLIKEGYITLFSSLDNLLKGAASQAIENINALYQLPLMTGLGNAILRHPEPSEGSPKQGAMLYPGDPSQARDDDVLFRCLPQSGWDARDDGGAVTGLLPMKEVI